MQSLKHPAPFFGSTDLIIEGFFNKLQAGYNPNTVPTVIRLTSKLQGTPNVELCRLCLGVRDDINNVLELGSPIKHINHSTSTVDKITSPDSWFSSDLEKTLCFGCKRLCVEAKSREQLLANLPSVITTN